MRSYAIGLFFALACTFCTVAEAAAEATVTVSKISEGVYSVMVTNAENAAAIDFSLSYDPLVLSNPVVTDGVFATSSRAISVPNVTTPGLVRVAYLVATGFSGKGGQLAIVTFSKNGTMSASSLELKEARIFTPSATEIATNAIPTVFEPSAAVSAGTTANPAVASTAGSSSTSQSSGSMNNTFTAQATSTTTSASSVTGTVTGLTAPLQPDQKSESSREDSRRESVREEPQYQNPPPVPTPTNETSPTPVKETGTVATIERKTTSGQPVLKSFQSVMDRFRAYKDVRSVKGMSALFDDGPAKTAGITQSPSIAVSDGKSPVTVTVELSEEFATPEFLLKGANLKTIRNPSPKQWELEALPQKGKTDVRLSIRLLGEYVEIPLIVVPPLDPALLREKRNITEPALDALLLKAAVKGAKPLYDLNADGRQDYLDDYILIAYWLLKQQSERTVPTKKAVSPR